MVDKIILIAYGIFLLVGGYFGFKKGSMISLAMGVGSGLLIFLGLWLMTLNPKGAWVFLSSVSGFLVLTFFLRVIKTQAFMPSGMLLGVSLLVLIFCLTHLGKP
ncbi:MAG: TMEM14 family protein [Candidatus Omnitrophica bacterium]|nr:TMEM14 family protein [Candidatus Omnitrophota bacterium]